MTKRSQATELVELAEESHVYLFHTPEHVPYALLDQGTHHETWPLRQKGFRRWLTRRYYNAHEKAPGSQAVQDALGVLEGQALFHGETHEVHVRIAKVGDEIFIDLGDADWTKIRVTRDGYELLEDDTSVFFRRPPGMLPLPIPVSGGSLEELRRFVNLTDADWPLYQAGLVTKLIPDIPHPVTQCLGTQGSAKSTVSKVERAITDPNVSPLRAEPREVRDLMIAATNSYIVCFDNVSSLSPWLSDALCRLSTGGGFSTRELYSDADEVIFEAKRPVTLNGITDFTTRGDLLDRSVLFYLETITESDRRDEASFWTEFEAARPRIFGALLNALAGAMAHRPGVKLTRIPRMADFTLWGVAVQRALGRPDTEFLDSYAMNRLTANDVALETTKVAKLLLDLVPTIGTSWEGTATDLLDALTDRAADATQRLKDWPKSAVAMSNTLRRLTPNLRTDGIEVTTTRTSSRRIVRLERVAESPSLSSLASPQAVDGEEDVTPHDGNDDPSPTQSSDAAVVKFIKREFNAEEVSA